MMCRLHWLIARDGGGAWVSFASDPPRLFSAAKAGNEGVQIDGSEFVRLIRASRKPRVVDKRRKDLKLFGVARTLNSFLRPQSAPLSALHRSQMGLAREREFNRWMRAIVRHQRKLERGANRLTSERFKCTMTGLFDHMIVVAAQRSPGGWEVIAHWSFPCHEPGRII